MHNKTSGPWCVAGVANFANPILLTFVVLMATSIVMPRAWCKFVCPNRGLFELLCGKKDATNCANPKDATNDTNYNE